MHTVLIKQDDPAQSDAMKPVENLVLYGNKVKILHKGNLDKSRVWTRVLELRAGINGKEMMAGQWQGLLVRLNDGDALGQGYLRPCLL
jgi:hypothetical protein